jgi:hypothetical protein
LGYVQPYDYPRGRPAWLPASQPVLDVAPHCITCSLRCDRPARIVVNVDGTGPHAELRVEVLDEQFRPLPGLSGDACVPVTENGLRQPVVWASHDTVPQDAAFRLQVTMAGVRPEDVRLYAIYLA